MNDKIKEVLGLATALVLSREGDITTEDGNFATVDEDLIINLEIAISQAFELEGDEVVTSDIPKIKALINSY